MHITTETVENALGQTLFRVTMRDADAEVVSKVLSLENYLSLLGSSMKLEEAEDTVRIPKGKLPEGYIDGVFARSGFTVVWREKAKARLLIHSTGHYQIPYPDLIFVLGVKGGVIRRKYCYAAVGEKLYRYPFGNVSRDGAICMGNIRVDVRGRISAFSEEFFLGETNGDYYRPGESIRPKWSQEKLLEHLAKRDYFPEKWLAKAPFDTVGELVEEVLQ